MESLLSCRVCDARRGRAEKLSSGASSHKSLATTVSQWKIESYLVFESETKSGIADAGLLLHREPTAPQMLFHP